MKLKKLLEGFAWERQPGKPLPTMKDVAKQHKVNEADWFGGGDESGDTSTDPKHVQKLVDKLKNNQGIKLSNKKITRKYKKQPLQPKLHIFYIFS
jgi:hypothetical protein